MARDLSPDAAAPARLRGQRPRAFERAPRAVPAARSAGEHPHRQLHDGCAVLPSPTAPGARSHRAPARGRHAEGVAAPEGSVVDAGRALGRRFQPVIDDASADKPPSGGSCSAAARSITTWSGTKRTAATSRSPASSSSTRSRPRPPRARRVVRVARRGGLGAGGAAEHGPVALDPPPPRGGLGGLPLRYVGRPWRASPPRAIRPPTASSRTASRASR